MVEIQTRLAGKVALITGAGRGIGRALAELLGTEGAHVVVNDIDAEPARETATAVRAAGGEAVVCTGSVTADDFADRFVGSAVDEFGGIDIIVNNAGYTWDNVIQKTTDEQWRAILDVHLTAPFRILRSAYPVISAAARRERATGSPSCRKVVNVSSLAGTGGNAGQVNYSAAKAGLIGVTKTLAKEWGRHNVTVNAVAFGFIETRLTTVSADDQTSIEVEGRSIPIGVNSDLLDTMRSAIPLGRAGTPRDGAGAIYLLCRPESDYISGQTIICGGGFDF